MFKQMLAATLLSALLVLPAGAHEATSKGVTVAHPWLRATPAGSTTGVAFMEISADDKTTDKLIAAASPVSGRVELHTHIKDGDVMKMRQVEFIEIKAGQSRVLKPGGDHVMLFELKQPLAEGDLVKLTLTFEKAGPIEVEGTVEPAGAMGPHGMDRQPGHDDMPGMDHSGHQ